MNLPLTLNLTLNLPLIREMLGTLAPKHIAALDTFRTAYDKGLPQERTALLGMVGAQLWPSHAGAIAEAIADGLQLYAESRLPTWEQVYGQDHLSPLCTAARKAIALETKVERLRALDNLRTQIRVLREDTTAYPGGEVWYREDNGRESRQRHMPVPAAIPARAPPAYVGAAQRGLVALEASVCASMSLETEGPVHWEVAHDAAAALAGVLAATPSTNPIHARVARRLAPVVRALPEQPEGVVVHPGVVHRRSSNP